MEALRRPFNPLLVEYVYECRDKHDVGASDAEELIGWLDLARDHGKRKIYLPAMSMVPV
jgi:hypothetical protein